MPELPEVQTTVSQLKKKALKRAFVDVWTDSPNLVKKPESFDDFRRKIKGKKIKDIRRRGKNIIFKLSEGQSLLIHQKLTGHLLYGYWKEGHWQSEEEKKIGEDKMNQYIHLVFFLDNKKEIALSDLRKFAKVELASDEEIEKELEDLGPDPLEISFSEFKEAIGSGRSKIKEVLMNQKIISGVGNIYSDEALFRAGIHPLRKVKDLKEKELEKLYRELKRILNKALKVQGTSVSDYRTPEGKKGEFEKLLKVYRRKGEKCFNCGAKVERIKIGGRSTHFCPHCQKK